MVTNKKCLCDKGEYVLQRADSEEFHIKGGLSAVALRERIIHGRLIQMQQREAERLPRHRERRSLG